MKTINNAGDDGDRDYDQGDDHNEDDVDGSRDDHDDVLDILEGTPGG